MTEGRDEFWTAILNQQAEQSAIVQMTFQQALARTVAECVDMPRGIPSLSWFLGRLDRNLEALIGESPVSLPPHVLTMVRGHRDIWGKWLLRVYEDLENSSE